jgi:NADH dehydrogenase
MAMIGRNSAVAEIGSKRHELDGPIAFAAWLGVHAMLMSSVRERIEAFITWASNYFGRSRAVQVLDRSDEGRIDWSDDPGSENVSAAPAMKAAG